MAKIQSPLGGRQHSVIARGSSGVGKLRLGIISTYPPRRCGLGTYTKDLRDALLSVAPELEIIIAAIDRDGLSYGDEVKAVIRQDVPDDYVRAIKKFAKLGVNAVLIEHEYGIFGGKAGLYAGEYALGLTDTLTEMGIPYAITLHTVLSQPYPMQRAVLRKLCHEAAQVTVFTETARELAVYTGVARREQIAIVPHGSPLILRKGKSLLQGDEPAVRTKVRGLLDELRDRRIIATFGLISPAKGIESAIASLPAIARQHPDVCYLIAGATHPEEVRLYGEEYRTQLERRVADLGMSDHVTFIGNFLTPEELAALLAVTEVYITPYRSREQICSGALTFALAAGCPVVSTPYYYAQDMVREDLGRLVPFDDTDALAAAVSELLADREELAAIRSRVRCLGVQLTWPAVARQLLELLNHLPKKRAKPVELDPVVPPPVRLEHIATLTDEKGIIQFAKVDQPDPETGYCVDDVTRLAIVAAGLLRAKIASTTALQWLETSIDFLEESFDPARDGLRNMRAIDGTWLDEPHMGDHVGRTVWALGDMLAAPITGDVRVRTAELLTALLRTTVKTPMLRPSAEAVIGLSRVPRLTRDMRAVLETAIARLRNAYDLTADTSWPWFEDELTYDNARLPQAFLLAGHRLGDKKLLDRGLRSLEWYAQECQVRFTPLKEGESPEDKPVRLIGNDWLHRLRPKAGPGSGNGDEQPLDAAALVEALADAYSITGKQEYADAARTAFSWFLGNNRVRIWLYDPLTGGCRDGLLKGRVVNPNMGAESTLAYYQALLALAQARLVNLELVEGTCPDAQDSVRLSVSISAR